MMKKTNEILRNTIHHLEKDIREAQRGECGGKSGITRDKKTISELKSILKK